MPIGPGDYLAGCPSTPTRRSQSIYGYDATQHDAGPYVPGSGEAQALYNALR